MSNELEEAIDNYEGAVNEKIASLEQQLSQANERIKALENPWVSVDERMPADDQHMIDFAVVVPAGKRIDQFYLHKNGMKSWNHFGDSVTHWMPIPIIPRNTND